MDNEEVFAKLRSNSSNLCDEAVRILVKIADNIVKNPTNLRVRSLQKNNSTVKNKILAIKGGSECLKLMGFEENESSFILPSNIPVNKVDEVRTSLLNMKTNEVHKGAIPKSKVENQVNSPNADESNSDLDNVKRFILPPLTLIYVVYHTVFKCRVVMSSTESEESGEETKKSEKSGELLWIASFVKSHPDILNKSQLPTQKAKKEKALEKLKTEFEAHFGKSTDRKKILKQLNNLKANVKKKIDCTSGNKRRKLSEAQKHIYEALNSGGQSKNPTCTRVPDTRGSRYLGHQKNDVVKEQTVIPSTTLSRPSPPVPQLKRHHNVLDKYETEETRQLSTTELQRLVLLEHLQLIRLKKQRLESLMSAQNPSAGEAPNEEEVLDDENGIYAVL